MPNPHSTTDKPHIERPVPKKRRKNRTRITVQILKKVGTPALSYASTVTERFQTTVPAPVRAAMSLGRGDELTWAMKEDGTFVVSKASTEHEDPAIQGFLKVLESGITEGYVVPATVEMRDRVAELIDGVEFDMNAPLPNEDEDEDD